MIQSGFFIVKLCFFQISQTIVADAKLHAGKIIVAVMENESARCLIFGAGQCHAIPEDGLLVLLLLQEGFSDVAANFRTGSIIGKRIKQCG